MDDPIPSSPVQPVSPPAAGCTGPRYGLRPATDDRLLHCVLPVAGGHERRRHAVMAAPCGRKAHLCDCVATHWQYWPFCSGCAESDEYGQYKILRALADAPTGGLTASQVADLFADRVTFVFRADKLIEAGLVVRDKVDSAPFSYRLTAGVRKSIKQWYGE